MKQDMATIELDMVWRRSEKRGVEKRGEKKREEEWSGEER